MSFPRQGTAPVPYRLADLPSGDAGVAATLAQMVDIVTAYRGNPTVRVQAQSLVRNCASRDSNCQVATLHAFVRDRITYLPDVRNVETLQTPDYTLQAGSGDCDDQSILLASLLESIGFQTRFCAQAINNGGFSHVSSQVLLGKGYVNLETIVPALPADWKNGAGELLGMKGQATPAGWFPPDATCVMLARVP